MEKDVGETPMTTIIRGKSGKELLRTMLSEHDECAAIIETVQDAAEPFTVSDVRYEFKLFITRTELLTILAGRMRVIETKLENLGLKIGDEVAESAQ